jgi:flavin reductase
MSSVTPLPAVDLLPDFKQAMRRLAATVTIITARHEGQRHGMAATAVNSVTTAPPTLLICVNQNASLHRPLLASGRFAVNLLGHEHEVLVPLFSGKAAGEDRFAHGHWSEGWGGLPSLQDAQAALFCRVTSTLAYGTHTVVLGEVEEIRLHGEPRPLIYQDGAFFRTAGLASLD